MKLKWRLNVLNDKGGYYHHVWSSETASYFKAEAADLNSDVLIHVMRDGFFARWLEVKADTDGVFPTISSRCAANAADEPAAARAFLTWWLYHSSCPTDGWRKRGTISSKRVLKTDALTGSKESTNSPPDPQNEMKSLKKMLNLHKFLTLPKASRC